MTAVVSPPYSLTEQVLSIKLCERAVRPSPITSWLPIPIASFLVLIGWSAIECFPISGKVLFPKSFQLPSNNEFSLDLRCLTRTLLAYIVVVVTLTSFLLHSVWIMISFVLLSILAIFTCLLTYIFKRNKGFPLLCSASVYSRIVTRTLFHDHKILNKVPRVERASACKR